MSDAARYTVCLEALSTKRGISAALSAPRRIGPPLASRSGLRSDTVPSAMSLFGRFYVQLDPWDVDYGAELSVDNADATPEDSIELDVEHAAGEWRPIVPAQADLRELVFVDGVR